MPIRSDIFHRSRTIFIRVLQGLCILTIAVSCYKEIDMSFVEENVLLKFDELYASVDFDRGMILIPVAGNLSASHKSLVETSVFDLVIDGKEYSSGDYFDFNGITPADSLSVSFRTEENISFDGFLHTTTLPVFQVFCSTNIPDEPRIHCTLLVSDPASENGSSLSAHAGIELRGRSAASRPKQSYRIELWENESGSNRRKISLVGMRSDDDWILDAMYIDKARMRNKVNMDIWRDICNSSQGINYTGKPYIESHYVEFFLNNEYLGIFNLMERYDRKQLMLTESTQNVNGLLYKCEHWSNTTRFVALADTNSTGFWDGWQQKYPDPSFITYWNPLYNFHYLVTYGDDAEFSQQISNYVNFDNLIDYFLLIAITKSFDNMGTNMFYSRYDRNSGFLVYPWDMDASWGRNWDSTFLSSENCISNKYFNRIFRDNIGDSNERIKQRWVELRNDFISYDSLMNRFEINALQLSESGACERERKRWPDMHLDMPGELHYIGHWLSARLVYLDNYFEEFEDQGWK
jgi:spore coat protein H